MKKKLSNNFTFVSLVVLKNLIMNDVRKILIISFLLFFIGNIQFLYSQITCTASAPPQVAAGQTLTITFTLNQRAQQVTQMQFPGFEMLSGPNQSSSTSMTIINGQTTQSNSFSYSYTLRAQKEGTFNIPAATFVVDGNQVKSNSVQIKVLASQQAGTPQTTQQQQQGTRNQQVAQTFDKNDVFVLASASKTNPYQGEQVIITHKLYIGLSVNGGYRVNSATMPTQSGLWSYTLGDQNTENVAKQETYNGKKYVVHEIRKTAVFPQKTGEVTITPMELDFTANVITQQSTGDPFYDRFFGGRQNSQNYNLDIKSNAIKLNVKPLPQNNRPNDFSNLVGNFTLTSSLSRSQLKANDATNLTITISGSGNLQHIDALNIEFPTDFDVTEPRVSDNINTKGNTITGSRNFEYVIIPRNEGTFTIPQALFSFFDNQTNSYKTLSTQEYKLEIEKGSGQLSVSTTSLQKDIKVLGNDIRFIRTSNFNLKPKRDAIFGSLHYYTALILPILLLFIFIIIWRKQIEIRSNIALMKHKKANKVARKTLKTAKKLFEENNKEMFYIEISRALWGYLSDKYHIPISQLSMENVTTKLMQLGIAEQTIVRFVETLQQCEFARFAPGDNSDIMQEMYRKATSLFHDI
ncbi:MAG: BatD family protein [Bacteroidales bacterium]|nr:BatD family protein [Bacteroidales bacterium]